jgi:hypothetical protein
MKIEYEKNISNKCFRRFLSLHFSKHILASKWGAIFFAENRFADFFTILVDLFKTINKYFVNIHY